MDRLPPVLLVEILEHLCDAQRPDALENFLLACPAAAAALVMYPFVIDTRVYHIIYGLQRTYGQVYETALHYCPDSHYYRMLALRRIRESFRRWVHFRNVYCYVSPYIYIDDDYGGELQRDVHTLY